MKVRQCAVFAKNYQQRLYFVKSAKCIEVLSRQELDAELSAVRKFVAFNSRAGFVAHAIPKGWWYLHFSFGLEGFDVLEGTGRRVRS